MQTAYSIEEYVKEVMRQLHGLVPNGKAVHFQIHTYNAAYAFISEELQAKGLCVVTNNIHNSAGDDFGQLEFHVIMNDSYQ